ncbi:hypothetical protein MPDQ_001381 [Monascus purpureus]|uniref:Ethionine resistance protein n=1 Tax=Monascus purpureus TaxID=5098 RepID=A0A507QRZ7_MONPU|nr:hypothetical protein MPDQ_001381 [Monascus purpureus]
MARNGARSLNALDQGSFSRSFNSGSPLAEAAIARDLADYTDDEASGISSVEEDGSDSTVRPVNSHSLAGSYRRPSFFTTVSHSTVVPRQIDQERLFQREREEAIEQERDLLSDNHVLSPERGRSRRSSLKPKIGGIFSRRSSLAGSGTANVASLPTETTSLLEQPPGGDNGISKTPDAEEIDRKWEEAVTAGLIHTTWRRETQVIAKYSAPLMLTFLLQYSLTVASIFTLGHLGKEELGAVSLASMTANITGYAVYQGLATSLDTLCAQAYGSGKKKLVGLQMQRMVFFLWVITIPIGLIWIFAEEILVKIVPEREVARMAGQYLKIVVLGTPGYALFESVCAPLNAFMNWLFVWKFNWGFVGAPIAVAITDNLLPLCLFLYVYFVAGGECWNGFTTRALQNWWPMVRLALPGLVMVEAECLAFEVLTLASSYLGTSPLAAQSVVSTISSLAFQFPFPLSIAGSTRIANLIGATLVDAAKTSAKVNMICAVVVGLFNMLLLSTLRWYIPRLFSSDPEVIDLVAEVLPLCAAFQLFDALACNCNGILRGLGRQEIGGYVQLFSYYVVAMPISMGSAFALHWGLLGLWSGVAIALALVALIEGVFLCQVDWNRSVEDALQRNAMA